MGLTKPNISWFERYRPDNIDDMVFSDETRKTLVRSWIEAETVPGNILFSGAAGTGKTATSLILIRKIIKNQADLIRIKSRSVKDVDDQIVPFVSRKPVSSKIKIVYIEELDRTSRQFQGQLKEDLMEKYQEYVSFICCTNHPRRIDSALRTRFTFQEDFKSDNIEGMIGRLDFILKAENAKYNPDELTQFVNKNFKSGMRDLINALQVSYISHNGIIDFTTLAQNLNIEDNLVGYVVQMKIGRAHV